MIAKRLKVKSDYKVYDSSHDEVAAWTDHLPEDDGYRSSLLEYCRVSTDISRQVHINGRGYVEANMAIEALKDGLKSINPADVKPIHFLIDCSGSTRGRPAAIMSTVIAMIAPHIEEAGIPFEVLGFTTKSWKGGESRKKYIAERFRRNEEGLYLLPTPGRLCDLLHIVFKSKEEPWNPECLSLFFKEGFLKENVDGEAVLWARERIVPHGPGSLIMIGDGNPVDDSTLSTNPATFLSDHLKAVKEALSAEGMVNLQMVDVSGYGNETYLSDDDHTSRVIWEIMTSVSTAIGFDMSVPDDYDIRRVAGRVLGVFETESLDHVFVSVCLDCKPDDQFPKEYNKPCEGFVLHKSDYDPSLCFPGARIREFVDRAVTGREALLGVTGLSNSGDIALKGDHYASMRKMVRAFLAREADLAREAEDASPIP